MKLDRFVKLAILLSAAYAVAGFLLKTQIASAVKNPVILPAVSALFIFMMENGELIPEVLLLLTKLLKLQKCYIKIMIFQN